jgi:DNA-binding IscR family transcriptional regulator
MELVECVNSKVCPIEKSCLSRHTWSELYREIRDCMDSITLEDLIAAYHSMDKVEYAI